MRRGPVRLADKGTKSCGPTPAKKLLEMPVQGQLLRNDERVAGAMSLPSRGWCSGYECCPD